MRVFVIWDLAAVGIKPLLEAVPELYPEHEGRPLRWQIPGITMTGRQTARDVIHQGIRSADHVIALLEKPSASVGWQVGLALGWGKSLQLAFVGEALPAFTQVGVLKGLFAHPLADIAGVGRLLARLPWEIAAAAPVSESSTRLLLCDRGPLGSTLREIGRKEVPGASVPPDDGWGLYEVPELLRGHGGVLWVLGGDGGGELVSNAVIAGFAEAAGFPVAVLRSTEAPPVVDVAPRERCFRSLTEYKQKLVALLAASQQSPAHGEATPQAASPKKTAPTDEASAAPQPRARRRLVAAAALSALAVTAALLFLRTAPRAPQPRALPSDLSAAAPAVATPAPAPAAPVAAPPAKGDPTLAKRSAARSRRGIAEAAAMQEAMLAQVSPYLQLAMPGLDPKLMVPGAAAVEAPAKLAPTRPAKPLDRASCQMSAAELEPLLTALAHKWTSSERVSEVALATRKRCLTCAQVKQILDQAVTRAERMDILRALAPRLVDPEEAELIYLPLSSPHEQDEARKMIDRLAPR